MKKIYWIELVFLAFLMMLIMPSTPSSKVDSITTHPLSIHENGSELFAITEKCQASVTLLDQRSSFPIDHPSNNFVLNDVFLNFSDIRGFRQLRNIEDGVSNGYPASTASTYKQLAMEFNVSKVTEVFGIYWRIYVASGTTLSHYQVQIRNSSSGAPASGYLIQRTLYREMYDSGHWVWENFSASVILSPLFNPYYLVLDGTAIGTGDYVAWYYDDNDGVDNGRAWGGNLNVWTARASNVDHVILIDEIVRDNYNPSEIGMETTVGSLTKPVQDNRIGSGNVSFPNISVNPIGNKTVISVPTTNAVHYNVSYNAKFSCSSPIIATYTISNGTMAVWEMNFTRRKVYDNYSVTFNLPVMWYDIKVFRNGTDITGMSIIENQLFIPDSAINVGYNAFTIRAKSPNVITNITTDKMLYQQSDTLLAQIWSNQTLTAGTTVNVSINDPNGMIRDWEVRPIDGSGVAVYSYTFALTDILGVWNITAMWASHDHRGFFEKRFNLTYIPRILSITTKDSRGSLLPTVLMLYRSDGALMRTAETDSNGYKIFSELQVGNYYLEVYRVNTTTLIANESLVLTGDYSRTILTNFTILYPYVLSITLRDQFGELLNAQMQIQNRTGSVVVNTTINGFSLYELIEGNYTILIYVDGMLVANVSINLNTSTASTILADYVLRKQLSLSLWDKEMDEPLMPRIEVRNSTAALINGTFSSAPSFLLLKGNYSLTFWYAGRMVGTDQIALLTNSFRTYALNYSTPHTLWVRTIDARHGEALQTQLSLYNSTVWMMNGEANANGEYQWNLPADTYIVEVYYRATLVGNITFHLLRDNATTLICAYNLTKYYNLPVSIYDRLGEPLLANVTIANRTHTVLTAALNGFQLFPLPEGNYNLTFKIAETIINRTLVNLTSHTTLVVYGNYIIPKIITIETRDKEGDEPLNPRIIIQNSTAAVLINGTYPSIISFTFPKGNYTLHFYYNEQLVGTDALELLVNTFHTYYLNYSTPHSLTIHMVDARYGESLHCWIDLTNSTGQSLYTGYTDSNGQYAASLPADTYTVQCYYPTSTDLVATISFYLLQSNYTTIVCNYNLTKYYSFSLTIYDRLGESLLVNATFRNSTAIVLMTAINGFKTLTFPAENYTIELWVGAILVNVTTVYLTNPCAVSVYCDYMKTKILSMQTRDAEGDEPLACRVVIENASRQVVIDTNFPSSFTISLSKGNYTLAFYYGTNLVGNVSIELLIDTFKMYSLNYSIPHSYMLSLALYDRFGESLLVNATFYNSTALIMTMGINGFVTILLPEENYTIELRVGSTLVNTTLVSLTSPRVISIHCNYMKTKILSIQTYDREGDEPLACQILVRNSTAHLIINATFPSIVSFTLPKDNYTITFYYGGQLVGVDHIVLRTDLFRTYALNYSTPHTLTIRTVDRYHGDALRCTVTLSNSTGGVLAANVTTSVAGYVSWSLPADNYTLECWYLGMRVKNVSLNFLFHYTTTLICDYDLIYTYAFTVRVTDADGGDFLISNITIANASVQIATGMTNAYGVRLFTLQEGNYLVGIWYQGQPVAQFAVQLVGNNDTLVYANCTILHYYFLILNCLDQEGNDILHPLVEVWNATTVLQNKTTDAFGRVSFTLLEGNYSTVFRLGSFIIGNNSYLIQGQSVEATVWLAYSVPKLISIHTVDKDQENIPCQILVFNTTSQVANVTTDAFGYYDLYLPDGNYTFQVYYKGAWKYTGGCTITGAIAVPVQLLDVDAHPDNNGGIDPTILSILVGVISGLVAMSGYLGVVRPRRIRERNRLLAVKKHYTEVWSIQHVLGIYRESGACLTHVNYGLGMDRDLLGGFLNAIQSFGLEIQSTSDKLNGNATTKEKGLRTLAYHGMYIAVSKGGKYLDLALVMEEEPSADLLQRLDKLAIAFESGHIAHFPFFGNIAHFQDLEQYLVEYFEVDLNFHHRLDRDRFAKAPPYLCRKTLHRMFKLEAAIPLRAVVRQIKLERTGTDPKLYDEVDTLRKKEILVSQKKDASPESHIFWDAMQKKLAKGSSEPKTEVPPPKSGI